MTKRTDIHREGAIVPSDYDYMTSYALASQVGGFPCPSINLDVVAKLQEIYPKAEHGGVGKCTLCGARYSYGDVWQHRTTRELIHVGHDCADKVGFVASREEYDGIRLALIEKIKARAKLAKLCNDDDDLLEAFTHGKHPTILDIRAKLMKYRSISPKQVAFVKALRLREIEDAVSMPTHKPQPTMLPVEGNTYPVKEQIKALGGRWDGQARVWMVPAAQHAQAVALVNPPRVCHA